ncbi:MAG: hypothetical protein ACOYMS_07320, partial [Terrimicrobiaceae bacterium]
MNVKHLLVFLAGLLAVQAAAIFWLASDRETRGGLTDARTPTLPASPVRAADVALPASGPIRTSQQEAASTSSSGSSAPSPVESP